MTVEQNLSWHTVSYLNWKDRGIFLSTKFFSCNQLIENINSKLLILDNVNLWT